MLNVRQWDHNNHTAEIEYATYIHRQNDDGTFQVWWPNKGVWSKPMNQIPQHIYDKFEEVDVREAFIEIL